MHKCLYKALCYYIVPDDVKADENELVGGLTTKVIKWIFSYTLITLLQYVLDDIASHLYNQYN